MNNPQVTKVSYGDDPSQFGRLHRPRGTARGVVVVIHGGFWSSQYDLGLGEPLAVDLAAKGWIAWNLEYRRVGNGGGWPMTFEDISAGIDQLAKMDDIPTKTVVTLGHSAGGHLAVWAAGRNGAKVAVTAAVSQAGVLDFDRAIDEKLGGDAVKRFMGEAPDSALALADPSRQVPLTVPVYCIHAPDDTIVPISQSVAYVRVASVGGAKADLVEVEGGHFGHIDTSSQAWAKTLTVFDLL